MEEFTTLIVNDNVQYSFPTKDCLKIKNSVYELMNGNVTCDPVNAFPLSSHVEVNTTDSLMHSNGVNSIRITIPFAVSFRHLAVIAKILTSGKVIPGVDLDSHADVYLVIKLCRLFGISDDQIGESFLGWTSHSRWLNLHYPEYMYLIYIMVEELIDFKKFFSYRDVESSIEMIDRMSKLEEARANPEIYVNMLIFFKQFKFETCFSENNKKIQEKVDKLNNSRSKLHNLFLINPHMDFLSNYFIYPGESPYDVWSCAGISVNIRPEFGKNTIASRELGLARFHDFTFRYFQNSPNKNWPAEKQFPFANVVFAGGSISKILGIDYNPKNARQSDCDMFVLGKTFAERQKHFEEVLEWFRTYDPRSKEKSTTFYGMRGSVITIYAKSIVRKFQVISTNYMNAYETISRFDLSHIQWCFWSQSGDMSGLTFYGTPEALLSMREKVTRFSNIKRIRAERLIKALHCGYDIIKDPRVINDTIDITLLIERDVNGGINEQLQSMIRQLYAFYYPMDYPEMDSIEEKQHIMAMIERDAKSSLITDDPNIVINNTTIGGNFENDYEGTNFKIFNPAIINNRGAGRRVNKTTIKSKHGAVRLTTSTLTIVAANIDDYGVEITAQTFDQEFKDFCRLLEENVYRMYRAGGVTRNILNPADQLKIMIPKYKIDAQSVKGVSLLRNQRGGALNIEEDLRAGDEFQVMFYIEVIMYPNDRAIVLNPLRFVKFVKFDPMQGIPAQTEGENLEAETEVLIQCESSITYEDV